MRGIERLIDDAGFYERLFGGDPAVLEGKRRMLAAVWDLFRSRFPKEARSNRLALISVPNRIEVLGKHTDYQGGETIVLAGPKNFFGLSAAACDGVSELVNADPSLGETVLEVRGAVGSAAADAEGAGTVRFLREGFGARYTRAVVERLLNNLSASGCPPLGNVKAVFLGDIPVGGGTSGSSSKTITDFLVFTAPSGVFSCSEFRDLLLANGTTAGMDLRQEGLDPFGLALSMYLAHFENGLDFGELRGRMGVGTFGGSEDHTAILLGERGRMLFCGYCPTTLIEKIPVPRGFVFAVAYSGKRAEKTKDAMEKYNRLSLDARAAVGALNLCCGTDHRYLRDFFPELGPSARADAAFSALSGGESRQGPGPSAGVARRAYHFFRERDIMAKWVEAIGGRGESRSRELGGLMSLSHELSREYLGNIVPEIDCLQKSAVRLGALGASGFGGGFGGCCYAFVEEGTAGEFLEGWKREYLAAYPGRAGEACFDAYPASRGYHLEEVSGL